jgi:hypothetical protein
MYPYQQLTLGLDQEAADEALEELLARVAEESSPYYGQHGYHGCVARLGCFEPVGEETDDDQA